MWVGVGVGKRYLTSGSFRGVVRGACVLPNDTLEPIQPLGARPTNSKRAQEEGSDRICKFSLSREQKGTSCFRSGVLESSISSH